MISTLKTFVLVSVFSFYSYARGYSTGSEQQALRDYDRMHKTKDKKIEIKDKDALLAQQELTITTLQEKITENQAYQTQVKALAESIQRLNDIVQEILKVNPTCLPTSIAIAHADEHQVSEMTGQLFSQNPEDYN